LVTGIVDHGHKAVDYCETLELAAARVVELVQPGDMVISLGAGNVNQICDLVAARLRSAGEK
jgi:UDP-N-acetylmuramate--alanine ligase